MRLSGDQWVTTIVFTLLIGLLAMVCYDVPSCVRAENIGFRVKECIEQCGQRSADQYEMCLNACKSIAGAEAHPQPRGPRISDTSSL